MVTKSQAVKAKYRQEFHYGACSRMKGIRGGVTEHIVRVRVSGRCQTWVRVPEQFHLPVKYGLFESYSINNHNAGQFHSEKDCPLRKEGK